MAGIRGYFVRLVNGKSGFGGTSYIALKQAVGETKADIICDFIKPSFHAHGSSYSLYAKNGVKICDIERA